MDTRIAGKWGGKNSRKNMTKEEASEMNRRAAQIRWAKQRAQSMSDGSSISMPPKSPSTVGNSSSDSSSSSSNKSGITI